jgi:hypothetical protein
LVFIILYSRREGIRIRRLKTNSFRSNILKRDLKQIAEEIILKKDLLAISLFHAPTKKEKKHLCDPHTKQK